MTYPELFSRLTYDTATVIFVKKNGEIRVMLCTRNLSTVRLMYGYQGDILGGHDKRCSIQNGNMSVYDMIEGDARSFNIERVISVQLHGIIDTVEQFETLKKQFLEFKAEYERNMLNCQAECKGHSDV